MFADYENLAVAVITSLLSGTGVFLLGVRDGRISASLLNLASELFTAVTAGLIAMNGRKASFTALF